MQAQELPAIPTAALAALEAMQPRMSVGRFSLVNASFEDMQRVGSALVKCGYYKDIRDVAQCCAKLLAGQELGLTLMEALTGLRFIEGKLEMAPHLMAARVNRLADKGYSYRVEWLAAEEKDDNGDPIVIGCRIRFKRDGEELGVSSFTYRDAANAGLAGANYKKYPRNMYYARAMSNGVKWYMPEVLGGGQVYVMDEIAATDFEPAPVRALAPVPAPDPLPDLPVDLVKAGDALGILPLGIHADLKKNGGDVTALLAQYTERAASRVKRGTTTAPSTFAPLAQSLQTLPLAAQEKAILDDIDSFAPKAQGPIPGSDERTKKAQVKARMAFDAPDAKKVFPSREERLAFATWALGRKEPLASFTQLVNVSECDVVMRALTKRLAEAASAHPNVEKVDCPCCGAKPGDAHFSECELAA